MNTFASSRTPAYDDAQTFNAPSQYTCTVMILHWIIAVLIIVNVVLGLSADWLPDEWVRPVIDTHKSIGITVLRLALLYILWRMSHKPPALPQAFPPWERAAAHDAHLLLYFLMIALPPAGWMHDSAWKAAATHPMQLFGVVPFPHIGHIMSLDPAVKEPLHDKFDSLSACLGYALYALLAMHIGGALRYELFDRHSVIKRMEP
jgi:cytochrome b561